MAQTKIGFKRAQYVKRHSFDGLGNITVVGPVLNRPQGSKEGTVTYSENVPNWKRKIRRNESATTTLEAYEYSDLEPLGELITSYEYDPNVYKPAPAIQYRHDYFYQNVVWASAWYDWPSVSGLNTLSEVKANAEALSEYLKRAIEAQSQFQSGVFLGELGETWRMVRNPAKALRASLSDWHKRGLKLRSQKWRKYHRQPLPQRRRSVTKDLSDSWLEYAYGVRPIVGDVEDAMKAFNRRNDWVSDGRLVYGKGLDESCTEVFGDNSGYFCYVRETIYTETRCKIKYYGKTKAYVMDPLKFNAKLWGFNLQDFVPTLWELMPYSFLIDYFTNIGDVLYAWSWGKAGLAWTNKAVLKERRRRVMYSSRPQTTTYRDTGYSQNGGFALSTRWKKRTAHTTSLIPEVVWHLPGSNLKWVNIGALAASAVLGRSFKG